jgi:hypothetical protein
VCVALGLNNAKENLQQNECKIIDGTINGCRVTTTFSFYGNEADYISDSLSSGNGIGNSGNNDFDDYIWTQTRRKNLPRNKCKTNDEFKQDLNKIRKSWTPMDSFATTFRAVERTDAKLQLLLRVDYTSVKNHPSMHGA